MRRKIKVVLFSAPSKNMNGAIRAISFMPILISRRFGSETDLLVARHVSAKPVN